MPPPPEPPHTPNDGPRRWLALAGLLVLAALVVWTLRLLAGQHSGTGMTPRVLLRLTVAALAGVGLILVLVALILPGVVQAADASQLFLRAYVGVIGAFLCIAAGFALIGGLSAGTLPFAGLGIDPRRGIFRVGLSLAFAGGLLVIPAALLLAVGAVYDTGAPRMALGLTALLGAVGALYGLVSGLTLGLLTVRARSLGRLGLAGLVGGGLGGAAVGALLSLLQIEVLLRSDAGRSGWAILALAALIVTGVHLGWSAAQRWTLGRLVAGVSVPPAASRLQVNLFATVFIVLLLAVTSLSRTLSSFVTSRPADTTPLAVAQPLNAPVCPVPTDPLELAVWRVSTAGDRPDLSCGNRVEPLLVMPGLRSTQDPTPDPSDSAFDDVAAMVEGARHEVLFTTMQWEPGPLNPGSTLARALARLHAKVVAHPEQYPDGLRVRLTLGNYPTVANFQWGDEVWDALHDLLQARVPLSDPALGWQVEVGNYAGTFPHSHVKLVVVDGVRMLTAGFNYGYLHFPPGDASGRGIGLIDLALVTDGPAAQDGVNVFDDLWTHSRLVTCQTPPTLDTFRDACALSGRGEASHPAAVRQATRAGDSRVFSLYRRAGFTEADDAVVALLDAAAREIDLTHVNFSMNLLCLTALLNPSLCGDDQRLPFMAPLLGALERGVRVRLITQDSGLSGLENQIAIAYVQRELRKRGIPAARFQARWSPLPLHAKAGLVDGRMLVVGSMNLHYSSWTTGLIGLNEAVAATSDPGETARFARLFGEFWAGSAPIKLPEYLLGRGQ